MRHARLARRALALLVALGAALPASRAEAQATVGASAITPPRLETFVEAEFPEAEKAAGKGATVVLEIAIKETGEVADVRVTGPASPAFDAAAVAAAKRFMFAPAARDGAPIAVKIAYRYDFTFKEVLVKKTTADFEGTVRDRATKKPLAGVKVTLAGGAQATTDAQGHFTFPDLPAGARTVTLSGDALTPVATEETLEPGKKLVATYEVEPKRAPEPGAEEDDLEIVVTAPRIDKQVTSTEVAADQGRRIAGTGGDVLKVVENLPGVARSAVGSGQLVVWGAAPEDTRVYVDGLRVPRLYHDGGYRSIVHSDMVKAVELIPGGYGPSYGRGLGGVVQVQLRPLDESGFHGSVAADTIDAAGAVRTQLGRDWHVSAAVRKSYLDGVLPVFTKEPVGDIVPIPKYADAQGRIGYRIDARSHVELGGLWSTDTTTRTLLDPDPALTKRQTTALEFGRIWARYENTRAGRGTVAVLGSYGRDHSSLVSRFGGTPTVLGVDSDVFGARITWKGALTSMLSASVGLDVEAVSASVRRAGSIGAPPREGDPRVFGQPPPDQVNADDWKTLIASVAPHAELDVALLDGALHVVPGARLEPFVTTSSRLVPQVGDAPVVGSSREETVIEPRLSARYALGPRVTLKGAFGVYHQPPAAEDLSAVFGAPRLGLAVAKHYVGGSTFALTNAIDLDVTAFVSRSEDLVARSTASTPLLAQALVMQGEGRSYGAQLLLRHQRKGRFFGWISYSVLRSERKDAPDGEWRLFDFDQTHVLTALGSYDLGLGFEIGARFRVATGFPRTPVVGAYYDTRANLYQPAFGIRNGERIPPFYAVDVRLAKRFKLGATSEAEVFLDLQNVTNHKNPEELVYTASYARKDYITGLPILPVVGARWSW